MTVYVGGQPQGGGGGDAAQKMQSAYGFAGSTNYLSGAVGTIQGQAGGFSAAALGYLRSLPTAREFIFGTHSQFTLGGWALGLNADRFKLILTQLSDGSKLENFVDATFTDFPSILGKLFFLHFVWDGTDATLYVQGEATAVITPTDGIQFESTIGPHVGVESRNQAEPFQSGAFLGAAYGTQVMTSDDVASHYIAVMEAAAMVDDPATGFSNLWTMDSLSSVPPTLVDQIGGVDLSLTGALSAEERHVAIL